MSCVRCKSEDLHTSPLYGKAICKTCFEVFEEKRAKLQVEMIRWTDEFLSNVAKPADESKNSAEFTEDPEVSEDEHSTIFS